MVGAGAGRAPGIASALRSADSTRAHGGEPTVSVRGRSPVAVAMSRVGNWRTPSSWRSRRSLARPWAPASASRRTENACVSMPASAAQLTSTSRRATLRACRNTASRTRRSKRASAAGSSMRTMSAALEAGYDDEGGSLSQTCASIGCPVRAVHQLTALSAPMSVREARHPARSSAATMTNRLRTEGTDHLLAAGRAVGARRFVAQSFAAFRFARTGGPVQTEADPLDPHPPAALRAPLVGILHLERAVTTIEWGEGLVLRYGGFYGPGTAISLAADAVIAGPIRRRRFPIVGDGGGVHSHVHIEDAAAATALAVDHGQPGIYNVVDDDPAPVREWLPVLASALEAKPPRRIPRWLGRLLAGEGPAVMMTDGRGASNAKAKRELGWQLRYPSWRQGFAQGLG